MLAAEMIRKTPPTKSTEALVTVLNWVATEKMEFVLMPRVWSMDMLMTVSWAPVSVIARCALA